MTFYSEISKEKDYIIHVAIGEVNLDEAVISFKEMLQSPDFSPGMNAIWDLTSGKFDRLDQELFKEFIAKIAEGNSARGKGRKVAVVVKDEVEYELGLLLKNMTHGILYHDMRMFRKLPDALAWLNRPVGESGD